MSGHKNMTDIDNNWAFGNEKHTPPPVGSPMFFQNGGESFYPYLVYTGALSFAYIVYRASKVVDNQLL